MLSAGRKKLAKRVALGFLCAALTAALASGLSLQGKHYFYCHVMGVVMDDPCAAGAPVDRDVAIREPSSDCCTLGRMPTMPTSALLAALDVPAAALIAILSPPVVVPAPVPAEVRISHRATGPPRAPAVRVHARSMIFLT